MKFQIQYLDKEISKWSSSFSTFSEAVSASRASVACVWLPWLCGSDGQKGVSRVTGPWSNPKCFSDFLTDSKKKKKVTEKWGGGQALPPLFHR